MVSPAAFPCPGRLASDPDQACSVERQRRCCRIPEVEGAGSLVRSIRAAANSRRVSQAQADHRIRGKRCRRRGRKNPPSGRNPRGLCLRERHSLDCSQ